MDPRLEVFRDDLADARLRGRVVAPRYVEGRVGRVVTGRAAVRRRPTPDAPLDTFYHYGETVLVFETHEGWAWCQSQADSYVGYVSETSISVPAGDHPTHFVATTGSYRYAAPDLRSEVIDYLPRHCAVTVAQTGLMTRGGEYARLDNCGFVPLGCLSTEPPHSADFVSAAELYLGCPYRWGGRSFLGIDCSGLVQNAFRDLGRLVPRDSDMQRDSIGAFVEPAGIDDLRRGDLLYMPGHVLIYAGEGGVIHADGATMTVRRESLAAFMRRSGLALAGFTVRRP